MKSIIRNFLAKLAAGRTDDGIMITLPDPKKIDLQESIMMDLLLSNGIDPRLIKTEDELKSILNQLEAVNKQKLQAEAGIRNTESAKLFNIEGQSLDPNKPIIGGTQTGKELSPELSERLRGTEVDRIKQKIADKKVRTEEDVKADLEAQNKKSIKNLRMQKMLNEAIDDASPGFANDIKVDAELVAENLAERMGLVYDDLPTKERLKIYDEAYTGLSKQRFKNMRKPDDDPEDLATGGRVGFFMGSKFPKGLATLREMMKFFSKGGDQARTGSEMLKMVNPKQFDRLLDDPNIYRKFDIKQGIGAPELIKRMKDQTAEGRVKMIEEILSAAKNIRKADVSTSQNRQEMIEEMMRRGVDRETAEEMANTISKVAEDAAGVKRNTPKLTDEGILELENILKNMQTGGKDKRSLNADGGRIGLKDGMNRRTFMKLFAGAMSIPIIGKIFKPLKLATGVKKVPIIKTDDVAGKPEWFDQLVNKVIIEGDDVTKKFATGERQIVHQKNLGDDTVRVTQDTDDGVVRVEYESGENVFGDPVQMEYRKPPADETVKPGAEFTTAESGPVGRRTGPDDFDIEIEEVGGTSIRDLDSDVSKLKEYATGKGPTMKEIVQNKKRRDKATRISEDPEAQSDAVIRRQGEAADYYDDDFASGGIARMLGE